MSTQTELGTTIERERAVLSKRQKRCSRGYYWAAIWPDGRQLWGSTVRREVERAARGTRASIVQLPKATA